MFQPDKLKELVETSSAIKPFTMAHFEVWLQTQPQDREYNWYDCTNCVVHAYFTEALKLETVKYNSSVFRYNGKTVIYSNLFPNPDAYRAMGMPKPWTFGAALARARAP